MMNIPLDKMNIHAKCHIMDVTIFSSNELVCSIYQIIAVTGFEGGERNDVKTMIEMTGAKYTGFFSRGNTLLISKR